jgi:soluble lytic murein transglycosylase-like protein
MRRFAAATSALSFVVCGFAVDDAASANPRIAAVQVALRAHGLAAGPVDGVAGPLTRRALAAFQRKQGLKADGKIDRRTRRAFGVRGRPLLGQRDLGVGAVGWDVAVLEFRLRRYGLGPRAVDGRFSRATAVALRRFQSRHTLAPDGIAGPFTYRALANRVPVRTHTVRPGESFYSIAGRYSVSPWQLARRNRLSLMNVIVPGQKLALPRGAVVRTPQTPAPAPAPSRDAVRAALDHWSGVYGVDPSLVRALAWMESGFQHDVVSSVGALGVMQLLPESWEFVDTVLLGVRTPRTYEGNVRAGVRFLRWQLDQVGGDVRLALAGWYQGARAVREIGIYGETKVFVRIVLALYGTV